MSVMDNEGSYYQLAPDLTICRIVNGMWQVAGGHGCIDHKLAIEDMIRYHDAGFTSWDLADIYGPAEDFVGDFRRKLSTLNGTEEELNKVQALTKWVPQPRIITRSTVNESMQIMVDSNIRLVSNQVQYSIIDRRPEVKMVPFCLKHNIRLLAYGTICGGLMSERYLGRTQPPSIAELNTLSLRKYKKMIDAWGGWALFQELLSTLNRIAQKYNVSIANVATRYILDKAAVGGVIIGARLGISDHINNNANVFNLSLDRSDYDGIDAICTKSNNLF